MFSSARKTTKNNDELHIEIERLREEVAILTARNSEQSVAASEGERKLLLRCQELMEDRSNLKERLAIRESEVRELRARLESVRDQEVEIVQLRAKIEEL